MITKFFLISTLTLLLSGENTHAKTGGFQIAEKDHDPKKIEVIKKETDEKTEPVQVVSIIADEKKFFPEKLNITAGIPTHLYLGSVSDARSCFILDEFKVQKQLSNKKVLKIEFTPEHIGSYRYYCPINKSEGKLIVKESSSIKISQSASISGEHSTHDLSGTGRQGHLVLQNEKAGIPVPQDSVAVLEKKHNFGVFVQMGPQYQSYWKFWQSFTPDTPSLLVTQVKVGASLWRMIDLYGVYARSLSNDVSSKAEFFGIGAMSLSHDFLKSFGWAGSTFSGARFHFGFELITYLSQPTVPSQYSYLPSPRIPRMEAGIQWEMGRNGNFYIDTSVFLFKPSSWYWGPTLSLGYQFGR